MAYLLLAIGALMSAVGAYSIISGSHIVQVEEGWTSVIAGATLFAGGIVTMALGLVLRALLNIRTALVAQPGLVPEAGMARVPAESFSVPGLQLPATPPPVPSAPFKQEPTIDEWPGDVMLPAHMSPSAPPLVIEPAPAVANPVDIANPDPAEPAHIEKPAEREVPLARAIEPPADPAPSEPVVEPTDADDYELETPSTPEHDLAIASSVVPPEPEPPASPPMDDWLDRAFAEFDQDVPKTEPAIPVTPAPVTRPFIKTAIRTKPVERPPVSDPQPELEPAQAEARPVVQEQAAEVPAPPVPAPVVAPTPTPSGPSAAVIGRYEAEGTTYVMYADGAIEAQSDSGVYRFSSMAELKAFIEN